MSKRLSPDDWIAAGFAAFEEENLDAVAVEPLARRLGTTKGSFYWHFTNREELVDAVIEHWRRQTEEIIAQVAAISDPRARLSALFAAILDHLPIDGGEVDLLARTGPPSVLRARAEVSERRIAFITDALRETGCSPAAARDRATQIYALWIGLLELHVALPELLPQGRGRARLTRSTLALLDELIA